jgi:large subunit ribosomal protein L22
MKALAKLNNYPTSPQKMRYVVDTVRGMEVVKALYLLQHLNKATAIVVRKLLLSAIDNWERANDVKADTTTLYVKEVFVDGGRMLKRFLPAPQGRAYRLRKRSNHITIIVDQKVNNN